MSLENRHGIAEFLEIIRAGQTGRSGTNDGDLLFVRGLGFSLYHPVAAEFHGEPFQRADSNRFIYLAAAAGFLARVSAYVSADGRKRITCSDNL